MRISMDSQLKLLEVFEIEKELGNKLRSISKHITQEAYNVRKSIAEFNLNTNNGRLWLLKIIRKELCDKYGEQGFVLRMDSIITKLELLGFYNV